LKTKQKRRRSSVINLSVLSTHLRKSTPQSVISPLSNEPNYLHFGITHPSSSSSNTIVFYLTHLPTQTDRCIIHATLPFFHDVRTPLDYQIPCPAYSDTRCTIRNHQIARAQVYKPLRPIPPILHYQLRLYSPSPLHFPRYAYTHTL
jgi:hypothetical protein